MQRSAATALPLLCLLLLATPGLAEAQGKDKEKAPKRPRLQAGSDTNDSRAYLDHGDRKLRANPREAADAFYWAMRLDPTSADALYGRRTALLMTDERRLQRYMEGDRRTITSPEIQRIDSLFARALLSNPFFFRKYERPMMEMYVVQAINGSLPPSYQANPGEIEHWWSSYLMRAGAETRGWAAYAEGRFDDALRNYGEALKSTRRKAYLRTERGRIFQMRGNADSAKASLALAVEELRKNDNKEVVFVYDSKALLEYSIGKIHEAMDDRAGAREAYGRALQEDLAFYPAHVALANLALAQGDTATMISEMELAVQLREDDVMTRLLYGYTLLALGKPKESIPHLERAIEVEPYFPRPYLFLAQARERTGEMDKALAAYEGFVARSAAHAPQVKEVTALIADLRTLRGSK